MIEIYNDVLTEEELYNLKKECDFFVTTSTPSNVEQNKSIQNFYFRKSLKKLNTFFFNEKIINTFLINQNVINYKIQDMWINKVNTESNKNDDYHTDSSELSVVIFLNDNFEGGEFEYLDNFGKSNKIKPEKNKAILMDNKLPHRVLPVAYGERFTLVCFLKHIKKENKSLI